MPRFIAKTMPRFNVIDTFNKNRFNAQFNLVLYCQQHDPEKIKAAVQRSIHSTLEEKPGLRLAARHTLSVFLLLQVLVLAGPGVMAATIIMAAFARFIFPYGWDWNTCLFFGAMTSATDPVAVVALMKVKRIQYIFRTQNNTRGREIFLIYTWYTLYSQYFQVYSRILAPHPPPNLFFILFFSLSRNHAIIIFFFQFLSVGEFGSVLSVVSLCLPSLFIL